MGQHASYALAAQNMQLNQIDCCMLATRGLELVNVATRSTLNVTIGCIAINAYMHWIFIIKRMKSFIRNSHKKAPSQIFERFLNTQRAESREERRKEPFKGLKNVILFAIWYHLNHLKSVKNYHRGVLLPVVACNFTKRTLLQGCFFTFQILQMLPNCSKHIFKPFPSQSRTKRKN